MDFYFLLHLNLIQHFNTIVNIYNNLAYNLTPDCKQETLEIITNLKTKIQILENRLHNAVGIIIKNGCISITFEDVDYEHILEDSNIWEQFKYSDSPKNYNCTNNSYKYLTWSPLNV